MSGEPFTPGLYVYIECRKCGHEIIVLAEQFHRRVKGVTQIELRLRCETCGSRDPSCVQGWRVHPPVPEKLRIW